MNNYDPETALTDLNEEALLPTPVGLRDMAFRTHCSTDDSVTVNRLLQEYLRDFDVAQKKARQILIQLAELNTDR